MPGENERQFHFGFVNSGLDNEPPPEDDDRDEKVENREEAEPETTESQPEVKETGKYLPFDLVTDGVYECQRDFKIGAYEFEAGKEYQLFSASLVTGNRKKCLRVQREDKKRYEKKDWPSSLAFVPRVDFKKAFKLVNDNDGENFRLVAKLQARRQEIANQKAAEQAAEEARELRLEKRKLEESVRRRGRTEPPPKPRKKDQWYDDI